MCPKEGPIGYRRKARRVERRGEGGGEEGELSFRRHGQEREASGRLGHWGYISDGQMDNPDNLQVGMTSLSYVIEPSTHPHWAPRFL